MGFILERLEKTRAGIRTGEKWSPWDEKLVPKLGDPRLLRPGEDVLRVWRKCELPYGTLGRFMGFVDGRAAIQPKGWKLPVLISFENLADTEELLDPLSIDIAEFDLGYEKGCDEFLSTRAISEKSQRRKPTWFGRGVSAAYRDLEARRTYLSLTPARNDEVRRILKFWPDEIPAGTRSRIL